MRAKKNPKMAQRCKMSRKACSPGGGWVIVFPILKLTHPAVVYTRLPVMSRDVMEFIVVPPLVRWRHRDGLRYELIGRTLAALDGDGRGQRLG